MPSLQNASLDEEPTPDLADGFAGGMNGYQRANRLENNEWADLQNVDTARQGSGITRRGSARLGTSPTSSSIRGISYYAKAGVERILQVANGRLYGWNGVTHDNLAAIPGSTAVPVSLVQAMNKTYIAKEDASMQQWDGANLVEMPSGGIYNAPRCKFLIWQKAGSRLIACGDPSAPDRAYFGNIRDPWNWNNLTQAIDVAAGDGFPLTGVAEWTSKFVVFFKEQSLHVFDADPQTDVGSMSVQTPQTQVGCVAHRSIALVGNDLIFLSRDGVRSLARTLQGADQEVNEPLSRPVQKLVDRINWSAAGTACATAYRGRYLIALPLDNASSPNYVLVYNTNTGRWSGWWSGLTPTQFVAARWIGQDRLYWGQSDGKLMEWLDYVPDGAESTNTFQDDGVAIQTTMRSRAFTCGEMRSPKQGQEGEVEFFESLANATLSVILDQGTVQAVRTVATVTGQITLPQVLPFTLPAYTVVRRSVDLMQFAPWRELQVQIQSTAGKLAVRDVKLTAFINTMEFEQ